MFGCESKRTMLELLFDPHDQLSEGILILKGYTFNKIGSFPII